MPKSARMLALLAMPLLPLVLSGGPAAAQAAGPLTPQQSASLDRAIRLWTITPAAADAAASPEYTMTPEGDHYHLLMKPDLRGGPRIEGGDLTASVRPLSGGRWQFDDLKVATPVTATMPASKGSGPFTLTIDMQGQSGHLVIDPSLATPSTLDGAASGATGTIGMPPRADGSFRMGAFTTHGVWQPAGPGRIDRSTAIAVSDLSVNLKDKQQMRVAVGGIHAQATIKDLSPDRLATLLAFARDKLPALAPTKPTTTGDTTKHAARPDAADSAVASPASAVAAKRSLTPAQREALHTLLSDLRDVASGFHADGTADDVSFETGGNEGHSVHLHQVALAHSVAAPGGRLDASLRMTIQGLSSPDIPPDIARDFVPHRLVFAPHVSGLSVDAVFDMLGALVDETNPNAGEVQTRAAALLAKGPVRMGLDELAFDLGPALVTAAGSVKVAGPKRQDTTGNAVIEAKGLNALIKRANTDPLLRQAAPVLIFLKGIGDEDDSGNVVWKVVYADGKMLVNGTDLSQLVPHK